MIKNVENKTPSSNDLKTYPLKPRLKGDTEIIFTGVDSNLFCKALNSINISEAFDLGCDQGTAFFQAKVLVHYIAKIGGTHAGVFQFHS